MNESSWKGPCKLATSGDFVAIFQVAQNLLKFAMSTLFVLNVLGFFFQEGGNLWTKLCENPPPPPPLLCPSPNNVGFQSLRAKTLLCVFYAIGRGGGGDFQERVWSLVSPLVEKKKRTFFHRKRVGVANFSGFWAIWKVATKSPLGGSLHRPFQLLLWKLYSLPRAHFFLVALICTIHMRWAIAFWYVF